MDVELALFDNVIVRYNYPCKWSHEATVTREEGKQSSSVLNNIPWGRYHAEDAHEDRSAEYIDISDGIVSTV